jgi:hypothetical protein
MRRLCRSDHFGRFYLLVYGERSWADRGRASGASARNPDSHPPRKFLFGELTVCATGFLRSDPLGIVWVWPSGARKNCLSPTIEVVVALSDSVLTPIFKTNELVSLMQRYRGNARKTSQPRSRILL